MRPVFRVLGVQLLEQDVKQSSQFIRWQSGQDLIRLAGVVQILDQLWILHRAADFVPWMDKNCVMDRSSTEGRGLTA